MKINNLPFEEYLARPELSKSQLATFVNLGDQDQNETVAMKVGSLVDCLVFEPELFSQRYFITKLERRGTKEWKAEEDKADGKELVKEADFDAALLMATSLLGHDEAKELLKGDYQVTLTWKHEHTGVECRARPDCIKGNMPVDLKTSVSIKTFKFERQAAELKYHWQDVWYCEGMENNGFQEVEQMRFVVVEKTSVRLAGSTVRRHPIGIFKFDATSRSQAQNDINVYRQVWFLAKTKNQWPSHDTKEQIISIPKWEIDQ